jgi:hypothetical protein
VADFTTIRSYLVKLGYAVDETSSRKFSDVLKRDAVEVAKFAGGAAIAFAEVGTAFVAAAAAVAGATVGLVSSVAKQDLSFQLYARRMYMGTDAARKLKIATDALGYSLEEIIWGPPELAERYHQLIIDQDKMFRYLGEDGGERVFRKIRDIGFQFTRMEPALRIFAMRLTEDVMNKLFGNSESLEVRLKGFVDWFESPQGFVRISKEFSDVLVPAIKWAAKESMAFFADVKMFVAWLESKHKVRELAGDTAGDIAENSILVGPKGGGSWTDDQKKAWWAGKADWRSGANATTGNSVKDLIVQWARQMHVDPAGALAIADKESGTNPKAKMGKVGEIGMFQVRPETGMAEGFDNLSDLNENIQAGLYRYREGLRKYGGDQQKAFAYYNGTGLKADIYGADVYQRYLKQKQFLGSGSSDTRPITMTVNVGGIHIAETKTSPDQIKKSVLDAISQAAKLQAGVNFAHAQGWQK